MNIPLKIQNRTMSQFQKLVELVAELSTDNDFLLSKAGHEALHTVICETNKARNEFIERSWKFL